MKKIIDIIRKHRRQSALAKLLNLCNRGIAGKNIPGLENISLQTWVELMGIYRMLTYDQPMPPMTKDAGIVISKVGLN